MISIFQIFRSLDLTFFIVLEAINHISICFNVLCDYMGHQMYVLFLDGGPLISICFNVLCDYMGHQMYVLFLDGGPLMVVQLYKEDDLKNK